MSTRNPGLPVVVVLGLASAADLPPRAQLRSHQAPEFEADDFSISVFPDDRELDRLLVDLAPQVIVTVGGAMEDFPRLMAAPYRVRRRWIHRSSAADLRGIDILECFLGAALPETEDAAAPPLVSVFTPVYDTGADTLRRTWGSLQRQSYPEWEWVVLDDHSSDPGTLAVLEELAADHRVTVHRPARPSGNIGLLKGRLCALARGSILAELDHDDVLAPHALGWVVEAFRRHPECGVAYTNWAEQYAGTDRFHAYPEPYAFGYGRAHWEEHPADYATGDPTPTRYLVQDAVHLNPRTIRHIVGVPNHLRAWTRAAYEAAGGYSALHVADDYELLVRLFLVTRFVHIPTLGYVQFYNPESIGNTQHARNREIQRIVRFVAARYEDRIHARLAELGVEDDVRRPDGLLDFGRPLPAVEQHCTTVLEID